MLFEGRIETTFSTMIIVQPCVKRTFLLTLLEGEDNQ
jgi:hypothetical protein